MKPLLLVLDDWEGLIAASPCWKEIENIVDIKYLQGPISEANNADIAAANFLMAIRERTPLTEKVFARLPRLELVLQTGGHAYHVDINAARERGVKIALGRHVKAPLASVPELTFAMALGIMHKVPPANAAMHAGKWPLVTGRVLAKKRMGILGLGRHGARVARIARDAFDMDVVAWQRTEAVSNNNSDIPRVSLDELLTTSDIVSIHLKLSPESTGLMNEGNLKKMKPGAVLINTARGAIIDEVALAGVLVNGPLSAAGLDVFVHEPLPVDSPLRSLPNVIITPHIGWTVKEVFEEFAQIACTQVQHYLQGSLSADELI